MKEILLKVRNTLLALLIFIVTVVTIFSLLEFVYSISPIFWFAIIAASIICYCYKMGNDVFGEKK